MLFFLIACVTGRPLWGSDGHKITAFIAQELLTDAANAKCQSILGETYLSSVATWADQIKHEQQWKWSGALHFINTPDWACNFDFERDCDDSICVAGAVSNYTKILQSTSADAELKQEALKFLIHFVGDIHQPLHVAFDSDEGGNTEKGLYEPLNNTGTLHGIWDYDIIQQAEENFDSYWVNYARYLLKNIDEKDADIWAKCATGTDPVCPNEWGNQTAPLACIYSYVDTDGSVIKNGFSLGMDYYNRSLPIVEMQLQRGGVRLAAVLNYLYDTSKRVLI